MAKVLDIYTRGSHKSDKRITPVAGQEKVCRARIMATGAETGAVFSDPGKSAWNPRVVRPDWDALMARLESGESDGVVVYDLARFARRPADGERLIAAAENGLTILDSSSEYDLTSASGKENFRHKIVGTAAYSDTISESSRRGKAMKAAGGLVDRRRSFGFEPDGVTIREEEARIIRTHAQRLLSGETQDALIAELNGKTRPTGPVPSVRGAAWSYTTYRQIMSRPRNAGFIVHNGEVVPGVRFASETILTDDIHYRLVALYAARKRGRQPSGRYLLTGIARCHCDSALSGRPVTGTDRRQYYCKGCLHTFIDARKLDDHIADWTVKVLSDPEHGDAIEKAEEERKTRTSSLFQEAAEIESTLTEIAGRLGRREISLARHDAVCGPLDSRLKEIESELAGLTGSINPVTGSLGSRTIPQADQDYGFWLVKWQDNPAERRGLVIRALNGQQIVIGPGRDLSRISIGPSRPAIARLTA